MAKTSVGSIGLDLVVNSGGFQKEMKGIMGFTKKAAGALAGVFAVKEIVDFGKECLDLGSDLQEVQNVVDVTFKDMSSDVNSFAKEAISGFGLSETMAKKYTGTFGSMAKAFGFAESQAYDMATSLTGLAGDVASFYNLSQDEAYTKLKSVFTGETESLKDLGVVMTQTALDSYALANGFGKTTAKMTEAEKVALRYQFVTSQLSAAQGDFARTSDGWANQTRVLNLQFESLKATIGQGLIAAFTPVIKVINELLGRVQVLATAFKNLMEGLFGKQEASGMAAAAEAAGSAADSTGITASNSAATANNLKKASKFLAGFDVITKIDGSSGDTSAGTGEGTGNTSIGSILTPNTGAAEQSASGVIGSFRGLLDFFRNEFVPIFEPIWFKFRDEYLPMFVEMAEEVKQTASVLWEEIGSGLSVLWETVIKPVYSFITEVVLDLMDLLLEFWNQYGVPIFEGIREAIENTASVFSEAWYGIVLPIFEIFMEEADRLWNEHLAPLVQNFLGFVGEFADGALEIYNQFIAPLVQWLTQLLAPVFTSVFGTTIRTIGEVAGTIADFASGIFISLGGITQFLNGIFTGDWRKAWSGIRQIFRGVFQSLVAIAKKPINGVIELINGMIRGVVSGLNAIIRSANKIGFDLPSWMGGGHFGIDIKTITAPQIPYLAEGGFAKRNTPQLAVIGDNRRYGEIVAPENKLEAMARKAAAGSGDAGLLLKIIALLEKLIALAEAGTEIIFMVDGEELARAVQKGTIKLNRRYNTVEVTV